MRAYELGQYEKSMPNTLTWKEKLQLCREFGFDYLEMSVDESDEKLARLQYTKEEREAIVRAMEETGVRIHSMCLSGHRKYPLGHPDEHIQKRLFKSWRLLYSWQTIWESVSYSWQAMMYTMKRATNRQGRISSAT